MAGSWRRESEQRIPFRSLATLLEEGAIQAMADIQLTDDLGKSAPDVKIDLSQPSSLLKYAKTELLHLAVAPDFIARAPQPLHTAAPNPILFQLKLEHAFQLGN